MKKLLLIPLLLIVLAMPVLATDLCTELISAYTFNTTLNGTDRIGSNNLIEQGGITLNDDVNAPISGGYYTFDGVSDLLNFTNSVGIGGSTGMSVEILFNNTVAVGGGTIWLGQYPGNQFLWWNGGADDLFDNSVEMRSLSDDPVTSAYEHRLWSYNATGYEGVFVDGVNDPCTSVCTTANSNFGFDILGHAGSALGGNDWFQGDILFVRLYNETKSANASFLYNGGSFQSLVSMGCIAPPPVTTVNTSINAFELPGISNVTISSSSFVTLDNVTFNTSVSSSITFFVAAQVEKLTGGQNNQVSLRILLDGTPIKTENITTVTNSNGILSAGMTPTIIINHPSGVHFVTLQGSRTGNGVVSVNNIDVDVLQNISATNDQVSMIVSNHSEAFFNSTSLQSSHNISFSKQNVSDTFLWSVHKVNSSGTTTVQSRLSSVNSSENSTLSLRFVDPDIIASMADGFIDVNSSQGFNVFQHQANTDGVRVDFIFGTVAVLSLMDLAENPVQNVQGTNESTDAGANNLTLSAGTTQVITLQHTIGNGTGAIIFWSASGHSTSGTQETTFIFEGPNGCLSVKDRTFQNLEDGDVYDQHLCEGLTVGVTYDFNLSVVVPTGETFVLADEFVIVFDVNTILATELAFIDFVIESPSNDTHFGSGTSSFEINITGESSTTNATCNLTLNTLLNASDFITDLGSGHSFNVSIGSSVEQEFNVSVECTNEAGSISEEIITVFVDVVDPVITLNVTNLTNYGLDTIVGFLATATDTNLFTTNFTIRNTTLFNTLTNFTQTNDTSEVFLQNINLSAIMSVSQNTTDFNHVIWTAADSHTTKELNLLEDPFVSVDNKLYFSSDRVGTFRVDLEGGLVDSVSYEREEDRYVIETTYTREASLQVYRIVADKIRIVKDSDFACHLVINDRFWFDAEPSNSCDIDVISSSEVVVTARFDPTTSLRTRSVGEVNVVSLDFSVLYAFVAPSNGSFSGVICGEKYPDIFHNISFEADDLTNCTLRNNDFLIEQFVEASCGNVSFQGVIGWNSLTLTGQNSDGTTFESFCSLFLQKRNPNLADYGTIVLVGLFIFLLLWMGFQIPVLGFLGGIASIWFAFDVYALSSLTAYIFVVVAIIMILRSALAVSSLGLQGTMRKR